MEKLKINQGFNFNMNPNLKAILFPVISVLTLIVLILPTVRFSYSKITGQFESLDEHKEQIVKLERKLDILREVEGSVLGHMDTSLLAVPSANPSLWKLNQVFELAHEESVIMKKRNIKNEIGSGKGLFSSNISFGIEGDFESVMKYLETLNKHVPLITIDKVDIKTDKESVSAKINITVYRANLPTQLPALTAPIKSLSNSEQELLNKLYEMKIPEFTTIPATDPSDREDPFK